MNTKNQKPNKTPGYEGGAEMPQIGYGGTNAAFGAFQFPNAFRELAEKSVTQARDAYAKLKTAAEDATDLVESTVEAAREGAFALSVKALDAAKTNSDASFALARELFGARTLSEVIELQSAFARRLFESTTAQIKEFQELAEKVVTDTTKPVAEKVEKSLRAAAA
jgi:phasin